MGSTIDRSRSTWWWVVALLIAAPAVSLAALGLRTVRLDRVEWEQQVGERQQQTARLADVELENTLGALEATLREPALRRESTRPEEPARADPNAPPDAARHRVFSLDDRGTVTFLRERVYFPEDPTSLPATRVQRSPALERAIADAHAAKAQGRYDEALKLFGQIAATTPALLDWARWSTASTQHARGDATALASLGSPRWGLADGLTPSGLPVALVASAYADRLSSRELPQFLPLLHETLRALRAGTWLLSFDERSFYDAELRRLCQSAGGEYAPPIVQDPQLDELATLAGLVRRAAPGPRGARARTAERLQGQTRLLLWSPPETSSADPWVGVVLSEDEIRSLGDGAIRQLVARDSFNVALRDAGGQTMWQHAAGILDPASVHPLRAIPGWDLAFSRPAVPSGLSQRRTLWYGLILMLVFMLGTGLWMTGRARQHELALARRQADFVAAVSHEFKSPLTSIRLYMERLSSGRTGAAESAEYYATVEQETARLERLVNRLLDSQQLQEGRKAYAMQSASIADAARDAIARMRPQAEAKGVRLELRAHDGDTDACFDRGAIADAIENLVENAIKYSPEGSSVTVATNRDSDAVRVDVQDHGIGIDAQDVPRIFDKFFRGRRGDATDVRGTGLGLSLVKAIVDGHGGTIAVTSVPGSGSCFTLTLPRVFDTRPEPDLRASREAAG